MLVDQFTAPDNNSAIERIEKVQVGMRIFESISKTEVKAKRNGSWTMRAYRFALPSPTHTRSICDCLLRSFEEWLNNPKQKPRTGALILHMEGESNEGVRQSILRLTDDEKQKIADVVARSSIPAVYIIWW